MFDVHFCRSVRVREGQQPDRNISRNSAVTDCDLAVVSGVDTEEITAHLGIINSGKGRPRCRLNQHCSAATAHGTQNPGGLRTIVYDDRIPDNQRAPD